MPTSRCGRSLGLIGPIVPPADPTGIVVARPVQDWWDICQAPSHTRFEYTSSSFRISLLTSNQSTTRNTVPHHGMNDRSTQTGR